MSTNPSRPPQDSSPAPYQQNTFVYFSDTKRLRERILAWDPNTERRGTIDALAQRLQNTKLSQDWENMSQSERDREEPRRTDYRTVSLAKRTLERALKGINIAEVSATIIVSELGSTFDELAVVPVQAARQPQLPNPTQIGIVMELAKQIAFNWLTQGNEVHPDPRLGEHGMPAHPEFVYRLSGEWESWNEFLSVEANTPEATRHQRYDVLEDSVFDLVGMVLHLTRDPTNRRGTDKDNQ